MKRSDMIDKLSTQLCRLLTPAPDVGQHKGLAKLVLDFIEKEGMQPPFVCQDSRNIVDIKKDTEIAWDYDMCVEWEEEDDTY